MVLSLEAVSFILEFENLIYLWNHTIKRIDKYNNRRPHTFVDKILSAVYHKSILNNLVY